MDFKLILLLLGLGHLVVVVLYALWGFFGGLKRELKCTAVLLILLLLGWLIFSDPAMMMGIQLPGNLLSSLSSLGVEAQKASVWEVVLQVLQAQVPNGSALFVEGREAYELAYDVVAGVLRGVGLIVITLGMLYLSGLIRFVSHIVKLIVTAVKKAKAKNALPVEAEEVSTEEVEEEPEQVVVLGGIEGGDDVVVTTDVNELPAPKPITQRIWGAVVGLAKACVVLCITFVPLSGIVSILDETSEETRGLISDLVSGEEKLVEGEEKSNVVDIVFDFVEDYNSSALGMCVESTSYFFGDSFSTLLFDSLFYVSTDTQRIPLRTELVTFIHAANALEGNLDYKNFEQDKLSNALDELKDSQLLPELMPVVIEYAYEVPQVKEALIAANQEALFLQLRYVDWDKDLEKILDAVKVVYSLGIFEEDFNYLTLDVSSVRTIVDLLSSTEFLPKALPVAVKVAVKLDAVQNLIKNENFNPDVKNIDWAKDLGLLVDVYEEFQKLGITSFEGLDKDAILDLVFTSDQNVQTVKDILSDLVNMDLFPAVLAPAGECIVDAMMLEMNNGQFKSLVGVLPIKDLTPKQWESDLHTLVDLADKFYDLGVFGFEIVNMDLTSPKAIETLKYAIDEIFGTLGENSKNGLNILRQDEALLKIIDWAFKNFDLVALDAELSIVASNISLPKEGAVLKELIDVYAELAKYPEFDINNMKFNFIALLEKEDMGEIVTRALEAIVESDIILNTLVPILEHKVVPLVSKYEGAEDLVNDIIKENSTPTSAELIKEVGKLVDAVFGARDLGLLAVPGNGLKAIDFAKTEEMKSIINAIFDTKLFEGFEARILKVVLKIAKIDVELSVLEGIDFDAEQVLLNTFIDTVAPVLQDERFEIFNDENKIVFSDEFKALISSQENAQILVDGLQVLFGDYVAGTSGSQLVPALLHPIYNCFLEEKLPENVVEIMEIVDINAFTAEELANDINVLVYVVEELIEFEVFSLINGQPGNINFEAGAVLDNIDRIFGALESVNILERRFTELLPYAINKVVNNYNEKQVANGKNQILVSSLYAKDFAGVEYAEELDLIRQAVRAVVRLLNDNSITQVVHLNDFIKNKEYTTEEFLTEENGQLILNVIEPLAKSNILPPVVKAADKQIYITVANLGLNIEHTLNLKNEELSEDLQTLVGILRKAVDFGVFEIVFTKDLAEIDYEILSSVLYDEDGADLSDLNILQQSQEKLMSEIISFALSKVAPKLDFTITPSDLKNTNVVNDLEKLSEVVLVLGEVVEGLDLQSFGDIKAYFKDVKAEQLLKEENLINDENVDRVCAVLALVSEMTYFEAISPVAFNELVSSLGNKDASIKALYGTVSGAELAEDLKAISSLAEAIKDAKITDFVLGNSVYALNEEAFAEIIETLLNTNIINNNNVEIINIIVGKINKVIADKVPALKGFEIVVESYLFDNFTEETWAADHALFAETVAKLLGFAFDDLGIVSINSAKAFFKGNDYKYIDFYTAELVEEVGYVLSDIISLNTVGALLPSVLDYAIDLARKAEVKGQELGLDFLYILEAYDKGELTNQMLAEDVLTLVLMAIELIDNGTVLEVNRAIKNKSFNDMELQLDKYAEAIPYLGQLNILTIDSAKFTTQIVNLIFRLAKLDYEAVEKDFVQLTAEDWLADADKLAEVLVNADAVLNHLHETTGLVVTVNGIKDFFKNDAKEVNKYLTPELIDEIVALAQSALSFNAGEKLIGNVVDYLLPVAQEKLRDKAQFASVDFDFLVGTVSQATLHDDVAVIGEILTEAIAFGLYEYMETKDIAKLELVHIANIVDLLAELNLYSQAREGWYVNAALVASDTTKKNFILTYEDLEGIDFEEDNEQLQAVIMQIDELLKENKHESLSEVINFAKDLGATYEQWATPDNGKAVVDILNGLADVDILMACGASTMEYVIYVALTKDIDIRFLYDKTYKGANLGTDIKLIASMLDEALEFGIINLVWNYPIDKVDLSHVQNIVKYADQLNIFGLDKANWTALIANLVGEKLGMNVAVDATMFAHVDWAKENQTVVDLIGKAQEILDVNKFESTIEISKFFNEAAYLSNQYVTEENFELIAEALEITAELDVLEVLLPGLAEFGMNKLGTGVTGDFTTITSSEFTTLAYMIREALEFGAVEMYNNILWGEKYFYEGEFDLSHVINIVKALEELNILAVDKPHLAQFIASKLNLATNVDFAVYEAIDYSAENAKVVEIIELVDELMQNTYLTNLEFIYHWIDEEGFKSAQYITDENALVIADIIEAVSELQLLAPYGKELSNKAFNKIAALNYLVDAYEGEQLVEDLANVATIVRDLVEFEVIDLFYWQTTEEFKFDALREAIDLALNLNILNVKRPETMALVLNKVLPALGVNASYSAADFANVDFANDDATILAAYDQLVMLFKEMNIDGTAMLDEYINGRLFMLAQYTNEITIEYAVEFVDLIADLDQLEIVIDEFALVVLNRINELSFVAEAIENGELTAEELVADVHKLVEIGDGLLEYELYDMIYSNEYKAVDTDKFVEIFVKVDEIHTFNELRPEWTVLVVNKLFGKFVTISEVDLAHITEAMWEEEIYSLAYTIVEAYEYLVVRGYADNGEINRLYNEVIKEKKYEDKLYLVDLLFNDADGNKDSDAVDAFLNIFLEASQSNVSGVLLHKAFSKAINVLDTKGIDLTELPAMISIEELQDDMYNVLVAAYDIIMFGGIELVLTKGEIDYNNLDYIYDAIEKLAATNVANKDSGYLMGGILKDEASRNTGYFAQDFRLEDKAQDIIKIVDELAYIARTQELNTVQDLINLVKAPKSHKLIVSSQLNSALVALANVLEIMSQDQFFTESILSGSRGYLSSTLDKYQGILDIYMIYTGETLAEDLDSISDAIVALCDLDVYAILSSNAKIPYSRVDLVETILTEILGLHYFNDANRIDEIVAGVANVTGSDLSSLQNMNLDLAGDAAKLVDMYEDLLVIFESPEWQYEYVSDFKTKSLSLEYVLSAEFRNACLDAFADLRNTTIFTESNGAILILLLPIFKVVLPEYYEALNFENCSLEDLVNDFANIVSIYETIKDAGVLDALRNHSVSIDLDSILVDVENIIDTLLDVKLLANGASVAVAELVLRDIVYGKTYKGVYFPEGVFDLSEISVREDANIVKQIAEQVIIVLQNANIDSLNDVKAHINVDGIKAITMNKANLEAIAKAMELVSEMTFVQANASALWNELFIPRMEISRFAKYAKYLNYEGASNEQFVEELVLGAQIIRAINDLGIVDVYNGAAINYDQAAELEALLTLVSELNYIEINHEAIYNFLARKVTEYGGVIFGYEQFTIVEDLPKFAKVYAELVPFLMDSAFPYTTAQDYLDMLRTRSIPHKKDVVKLAYDYRADFLDAYHIAREEGLGKYAVIFALPAVKVVLPEFHAALNLEGYTYEDLEADALIAIEIAKIAKDSQLLEVLRDRGAAVVDFDKAVADAQAIMAHALGMKIIGNGSFGKLVNVALENYVYGKTIAGITMHDCHLDFTNFDSSVDKEVLKEMAQEVLAIIENSGIVTLSDAKALANVAGIKQIVMDEVNLEHIANIMDLLALSTFVQDNAANVWSYFVIPNLEASRLSDVAKLVRYNGATSAELLEDLQVGADIIRAVNDLGIVDVYYGAQINYDQADEVEDLLVLISSLHYFDIHAEQIYSFIENRAGTLHANGVGPLDLEIAEDLVRLADVYRAALPILLDIEYPFTTLNQYLDILRTRNIPNKASVVNAICNNMQAAVDAYDELLDLHIVKYGVVPAYNKVMSTGLVPGLVSLVDPSSLTIEEIEVDLNLSAEIAQSVVDSGIKFGVEDGKLGILASSELDFDELDYLVELVFALNCLEGDFDAIVEKATSKVGLSLEGTYTYEEEADLISEIFALAIAFEDELGFVNLGEMIDYYKDLENTVDLVMSNTDLQNAIVHFIGVASQTTLGKDLVVNGYNQFAKPSLPVDYQDFIDFEDPTYLPELWKIDFKNMFIIYNELEDLNYSGSFVPTMSEVKALYEILFMFNTPYSVAKAPQAWLDKLFFSNLPTLGQFEPEYSAVTDWEDEILKIHAVLSNLVNVLGADTEVVSLNMADFYELDNVSYAEVLLRSINNSLTMRTLILAILDEAINANTSSDPDAINLAELTTPEYEAQFTAEGYAYDTTFWTYSEFFNLAEILVFCNLLLVDEYGNFDDSKLDIADASVLGEYRTGAVLNGVVNTDKLGLGHLIIALHTSNIFDVTSFGGSDGLIADKLQGFISSTELIGEITDNDSIYAMLDVIVAVNAATNNNLNAYGIETIYNNIGSDEVADMFASIKASEVLRGILPFLMHDLVETACAENSVTPALAYTAIELVYGADLANALETPSASNASVIYGTDTPKLIAVLEAI